MEIEFKLKIREVRKLISVPATQENNYENDLSDVIIRVYYSFTGSKEGHSYTYPGDINLQRPLAGDDFIPIENITEEIVLGWINDMRDLDELKYFIESELDKAISPPETSAYFDWLPDPFANIKGTPENPISIETEESSEDTTPIETEESSSDGE